MSDLQRSPQMPGFVEISRKRGRIPGFALPKVPTQIVICGANRPAKKRLGRNHGWSFPPAVREILLNETVGSTVIHLFGGHADFGLRLDVDPLTNPDVIGDAWLPPFARDTFDAAILDPPYFNIRQQEKTALLRAAAWIVRPGGHVYWFHTIRIDADRSLPLRALWLIDVGRMCSVRVLQKFEVTSAKLPPVERFTRGPAIKYNRWLVGNGVLPFGAAIEGGK